MKIFVPKESWPGETHVPVVPDTARKLVQAGAQVEIESGLGSTIGISDAAYTDAGATVNTDRASGQNQADMVIRLRPPTPDDIRTLKANCIHVSYIDPFFNQACVEAFDTRPVVEEQVQSLGAKFVKIDIGETGQTQRWLRQTAHGGADQNAAHRHGQTLRRCRCRHHHGTGLRPQSAAHCHRRHGQGHETRQRDR